MHYKVDLPLYCSLNKTMVDICIRTKDNKCFAFKDPAEICEI